MAFLRPHFDYDVFVSYSHGVAPGVTQAPLRDWTLRLIDNLEADMRAASPDFDDLHIWRDQQIDPTMQLSDELRGKVSYSGILMIVMSPKYLASAWCKDELEWFRQQVQNRARDQGRVFVVRALNTDEKAWPDFLRDNRGHAMPGFKFYDKPDAMPFGWRGAGENSEAYVKALGGVQAVLIRRLRELRNSAQRRAGPELPKPAAAPAGAPTIYLHARPEHSSTYNEVKGVLEQDGIRSLGLREGPGADMASWGRASDARIEAAKHCDALALVRADDSVNFIGDLIQVGTKERERIESARGAPLPCAVLDRSGQALPIDVSGLGIERFDIGRDDWRGRFHGWLDQARQQAVAPP